MEKSSLKKLWNLPSKMGINSCLDIVNAGTPYRMWRTRSRIILNNIRVALNLVSSNNYNKTVGMANINSNSIIVYNLYLLINNSNNSNTNIIE